MYGNREVFCSPLEGFFVGPILAYHIWDHSRQLNDTFFDEGDHSKPVAEAIHWYSLVFEGQGQMTRSMCCCI
jgi:hypothetical protein